jgi:penicillin amidase
VDHRLTRDRDGLPGVVADDLLGALRGVGRWHGRDRPLQCALIAAMGEGALAARLLPKGQLVALDALVHRLDLPARGRRAAQRLDVRTRARLEAYLDGLDRGLAESRGDPGLSLLRLRPRAPELGALIAGFLGASFLGLAEGQERMERSLVELVAAGADPRWLERAFAPHLDGWAPERAARAAGPAPLGFAAHGLTGAGGSNAWAVDGTRSASGVPLLAADPHLQIDQLPALFYEVRVRCGARWWLGASIPGLPGLAVGRNQDVAWSGTFAVADNVDAWLETPESAPPESLRLRRARVRRRGLPDLELELLDGPRGTLERPPSAGRPSLAPAWAGAEAPERSIAAYLDLTEARSAAEAERALEGAANFSLHFVLADRHGDVRYVQTGRIPRRSGGWSGLDPAEVDGPRAWCGFHEGRGLPRAPAQDGLVASANEARPAPDGGVLSTLAQPSYRLDRITEVLSARRDHDLASMAALQLDLVCGRAARLRAPLRAALPDGPLARALDAWDGRMSPESTGATAFVLLARAATEALAPQLGGRVFLERLEASELSVWCCAALDRLLADPRTWAGPSAVVEARDRALRALARCRPSPWGEVQQLSLRHAVLGGLPRALGLDRGPFPLAGSIGTVCQGNVYRVAGGPAMAAGPAYRMVAPLDEDALWTTLPGGISGHPRDPDYVRWLDEYREGRLHRLVPPSADEATAEPCS